MSNQFHRMIKSENIPEDLKDRSQFVVWKILPRASGRDSKIPINLKTGRNASVKDPRTWGTFLDAFDYLSKHSGVSGIGFVFSEDDPFTGVDLDGCRDPETGEIESWARQIISALGSYTEVSPSQAGVKAFVEGSLPGGGRKNDRIEMYDQKRFFTMTGCHLEGTP